MLTSALALGACIGAFGCGILLKNIGRRTMMILCDIIGFFLGFIFLIKNYWVACVCRLVMGVLVGVNSAVVPLYVREITPVKIMGITGSFPANFMAFGTTFSYLVGLGFPKSDDEDKLDEKLHD